MQVKKQVKHDLRFYNGSQKEVVNLRKKYIHCESEKKLDPFPFEHNWQILSDFNNYFTVADRN